MKPHLWFVLGAWLAALGVVNGAFAAHGLRDHLPARYMSLSFDDPDVDLGSLLEDRYDQYDTGVRYHMYHAIGLMLLGLVATRKPSRWWNIAGFGMFLGIILFSAVLYALVLTNRTMLGAVVPIGGVFSIIGWVAMGCGCLGGFDRPAAETPVETPAA
ncbi:MAG: DUF423 domain-containing protein [Pirellula sp.]|nr:DUF423 domain-containing protein [Pirellula sp.]